MARSFVRTFYAYSMHVGKMHDLVPPRVKEALAEMLYLSNDLILIGLQMLNAGEAVEGLI